MTDDLGTQLYDLHQANRELQERLDRSVRHSKNLYKRLRSARAEATGRKAYAEDLKAKIVEQHIELCELRDN